MRFIRSKLTFANVVALLALFLALGGSAYAIHLGKNAVKTKNIKDGAVTEAKIANAAITASKLAAGAVKTPSVVVRVASKPLNDGTNATPTAVCHPGEVAVGGGALTSNDGNGSGDIVLTALRPLQASQANAGDGDTAGAYVADYVNVAGGTGSTTAFAYALCMK
jgi:hypothetical protein